MRLVVELETVDREMTAAERLHAARITIDAGQTCGHGSRRSRSQSSDAEQRLLVVRGSKPSGLALEGAVVHRGQVPTLRPPATGLDDGVVGLRLFAPRDLSAVRAATRPGGNEGFWLIVDNDDPRQSLAKHIDSWSVDGEAGHALAIVDASSDALVGSMHFKLRAEDSVELSYGIAPAWRKQGVATRAAILASDWLLSEGWARVELRIDDNNRVSQRVAGRAGFHSAGRVRTWVPSAGREFEDRLYLRVGSTDSA